MLQIFFILHAIAQRNVKITFLLDGIQVFLVYRESKNGFVRFEQLGRAVALMYITIDDHSFGQTVLRLHCANRNGQIVHITESLRLVGERMVKASTNMDGYTVLQRQLRGADRPTAEQQEQLDD